MADLSRVFSQIWTYKVPEEVNEILFCNCVETWPRRMDKKHPIFEAFRKVNHHNPQKEELLSLNEALKQLKLEM